MSEMRPSAPGRMRLEYRIPARGLIGYRSQFMTDTRGTGVLYTQFAEYGPYAGADIRTRQNGVLIAQRGGRDQRLRPVLPAGARRSCSSGPSIKVYGGQIVGIHARDNDLVVNPTKAKKLTNIRTTAADEKLVLAPPRQLTLEYALEFINDDELVEVTPQGDPPAQARPRSQRAQAHGKSGEGRLATSVRRRAPPPVVVRLR